MVKMSDLKKGSLTQGLDYLQQIPTEQLYRLYIEPVLLQTEGPVVYDTREKGYSNVKMAFDGLLYALRRHVAGETNLDSQLLERMQQATLAHHDDRGLPFNGLGYPFAARSTSLAGIKEFLVSHAQPPSENANHPNQQTIIDIIDTRNSQSVSNKSRLFYAHQLHDGPNQPFSQKVLDLFHNDCGQLSQKTAQQTFIDFRQEKDRAIINNHLDQVSELIYQMIQEQGNFVQESQGNKQQAIESILKHCEAQLEKAQQDEHKTADDIIAVIASAVQQCEQIHPFKEANGRTIVNSLANYLLMKNGLPPVIYDDPWIVDMHSQEEVKEAIKQGCLNTLQLIENKDNLHDFSHQNWLANQQQSNSQYYRLYQNWLSPNMSITKEAIDTLKLKQQLNKIENDLSQVEHAITNKNANYQQANQSCDKALSRFTTTTESHGQLQHLLQSLKQTLTDPHEQANFQNRLDACKHCLSYLRGHNLLDQLTVQMNYIRQYLELATGVSIQAKQFDDIEQQFKNLLANTQANSAMFTPRQQQQLQTIVTQLIHLTDEIKQHSDQNDPHIVDLVNSCESAQQHADSAQSVMQQHIPPFEAQFNKLEETLTKLREVGQSNNSHNLHAQLAKAHESAQQAYSNISNNDAKAVEQVHETLTDLETLSQTLKNLNHGSSFAFFKSQTKVLRQQATELIGQLHDYFKKLPVDEATAKLSDSTIINHYFS